MNPLEVPHKSPASASPNGAADSMPLQRAVELIRAGLAVPAPAGGFALASPERSGAGESTLSLTALAQALRRRWPWAVGLGFLAAVATALLVFLVMPVRYTVQRVVRINSKPAPWIVMTSAGGEEVEFAIYKANQAALIKSPMVLLNAVKSLEKQDLQMLRNPGVDKWLETALKTDFLLGPEMMRVTLSGDNPQEVAALLNAVVDSFVSESKQLELDRRQETLRLLRNKKQVIEESYWEKKNTLRKARYDDDAIREQNYKDALQGVILGEANVLSARIELEQAKREKAFWEQRQTELNAPDFKFPEQDVNFKLQDTPEWKFYQDRDYKLRNDIFELEKFPEGETLLAKRKELERLTRDWNALRERLRPELESRLRVDELAKIRVRLHDTESKIVTAQQKQDIVKADLDGKNEKAQKLNPSNADPADIQVLRGEIKELDTAKTKIGDVIHALDSEPLPAPRVTAWQEAKPPTARDWSRQLRFAVAGGFGLFLLAAFGVGYVELRLGKINAVEDLTAVLKMNVLGTLPALPARGRQGASAKADDSEQSRLDEAVDAVRTVVMHTARNDNMRVIMVASPGAGEGRTTLAGQLAASLARAWRNTLLIDGALRHPALHTRFNLPLDPGLSEVLRGEANANDVIKPTTVGRLWLMPAGHWDAHAVQALAQDNIKTFFDTLKRQYEFIIVDSSPLLPFADALSLSQNVDGVLFAVLRDVSRLPELKDAQQRLTHLNVRTLGAVLIGR